MPELGVSLVMKLIKVVKRMEIEMKNETKEMKGMKRGKKNFLRSKEVIVSGIFLNLALLMISYVLHAQNQIEMMQLLTAFGK